MISCKSPITIKGELNRSFTVLIYYLIRLIQWIAVIWCFFDRNPFNSQSSNRIDKKERKIVLMHTTLRQMSENTTQKLELRQHRKVSKKMFNRYACRVLREAPMSLFCKKLCLSTFYTFCTL